MASKSAASCGKCRDPSACICFKLDQIKGEILCDARLAAVNFASFTTERRQMLNLAFKNLSRPNIVNYVIAKELEIDYLRRVVAQNDQERQAYLNAYHYAQSNLPNSIIEAESSSPPQQHNLRLSRDAPVYQPSIITTKQSDEKEDCCKTSTTTSSESTLGVNAIVKPVPIETATETIETPLDWVCTICYDEEAVDQRPAKLQCKHIFHESCLVEWTSKGKTNCPNCRASITSIIC
jgi:hypothetical protein